MKAILINFMNSLLAAILIEIDDEIKKYDKS